MTRSDSADSDRLARHIIRIERGEVPATEQLLRQLKTLITTEQLESGARMPPERELIERAGVSRITVRAAMGRLESEGWVVRKQGLGTFVATPVVDELASGVRSIFEVLADQGVVPTVRVLGHHVGRGSAHASRILGTHDVLTIRRLYGDGHQPVALATITLPSDALEAARPLLSDDEQTETTYTMWEKRLSVRIKDARYQIHAAAASPEVAGALELEAGAPVLVLERESYGYDGSALELVVFHYRPERYQFSVTLPRILAGDPAGITERTNP
jgi:GntR family transcriptional regulator